MRIVFVSCTRSLAWSRLPPIPLLHKPKKMGLTKRQEILKYCRRFAIHTFWSSWATLGPRAWASRALYLRFGVTCRKLDLCSFRCCCMPVLLVISHTHTCELDPTTSARVRRCSSLVYSLVPWARTMCSDMTVLSTPVRPSGDNHHSSASCAGCSFIRWFRSVEGNRWEMERETERKYTSH